MAMGLTLINARIIWIVPEDLEIYKMFN